jgi:hypothetical protein
VTLPGRIALDIPVRLGRDEARRRAEEELAKAKYGGRNPGWDSLLERISRWLERLSDLYLRLTRSGQPGDGVSWGFVVAVLVLLVALGLVIWKVGLPRWRGRTAAGRLDLVPGTPAADYRNLAEAAAERGDWPAAVRDRFRGLVREMETRTLLQVRPARTAWEAAVTVARVVPAAEADLFLGADLFNRVVYGDQHAESTDYRQMVAVDAAVLAAADDVDLTADDVPLVTR